MVRFLPAEYLDTLLRYSTKDRPPIQNNCRTTRSDNISQLTYIDTGTTSIHNDVVDTSVPRRIKMFPDRHSLPHSTRWIILPPRRPTILTTYPRQNSFTTSPGLHSPAYQRPLFDGHRLIPASLEGLPYYPNQFMPPVSPNPNASGCMHTSRHPVAASHPRWICRHSYEYPADLIIQPSSTCRRTSMAHMAMLSPHN